MGPFKFILLSTLLTLAFLSMASSQTTVHYLVGMPRPSNHVFEVELKLDHLSTDRKSLDIQLPVWRPGRYVVLDFAGGVVEFAAEDGKGNQLRWHKTEKSVWQIETNGSTEVRVRYKVYANEFGQRTRGLNDEHAFIDGSAVFMYAEEFRSLPVALTVHPYGSWHVTTGLDGSGTSFNAPDYDTFVDCPLEIGNQHDFQFDVDGVPHTLCMFGEGNWTADTLIKDITTIVKAEKAFWGSFPYKRYIFLVHCTPQSGGGTEHLNSTIIGIRPYIFKNPDQYRGFLSVVSHEYFHTWNVKQLRPKGIHPYQYMKENYTRELWIAEGSTSYYDELLLVRSGLTKFDKYLENIASIVQGDRQRPGNKRQSAADASFDAWVKYWKGQEESWNFESDYYGKGAILSFILDMEIRKRSAGGKSLDDVFRSMFQQFPLSGTGYTLEDFEQASSRQAGSDMSEIFTRFVTGTEPLPWEEYLSVVGLELVPKDSILKPWLGCSTSDNGMKTSVTSVVDGSPAYLAGVDLGDEVLALNGNRIRSSDLADRISELKPGTSVTLTLFHNDKLKELKITLGTQPVPAYRVVKSSKATDLQKQTFKSWLNIDW